MKYESFLVLGNKGMVGSAVENKLRSKYERFVFGLDRDHVDLRKPIETCKVFSRYKPDVAIVAAAKVGGIKANNTYRAQFIYDNIMIAANVINAAYMTKVKKLIFLGSSCIYPKLAKQPIREEYLLTGKLEPTNEPYAIAKIAGIKLCENYYKQYGCNFYSLMPTNLYGPNDNFDLNTSHVLPALIRKFHEAKEAEFDSVKIWGSGKALREFMYVTDLVGAIQFCIDKVEAENLYSQDISHLNVGTGVDLSISDLANMICEIVGYKGKIVFDTSMPDGTPRKLLDVKRIHDLGWHHKTDLKTGIRKTYQWFIKNYQQNIIQSTETIDLGDTIEKGTHHGHHRPRRKLPHRTAIK